MRPIDADVLEKEGWSLHRTVRVDRDTSEYQIKPIAKVPTIEQEETGEWVKVHGYATPGGDPVWACPKCGKGIHVYGIEHGTYGKDIADHQWVACPNCGAKLI